MKLQRSIDIAAAPEKVWPFLVEPQNVLEWCVTFLKYEYLGDQHSGAGTRVYIEEKAGGPLMKMEFLVTGWKENEEIALKMISQAFLKVYPQSWKLQRTPGGSTFTFSEELEFPYGVFGRLLAWLGRGSSESHIREMLERLKALAEA